MNTNFEITSSKRNWFTIRQLISKDFTLKYRRSMLGILWSVLNPLLMMIVLTLVFSNFFRFNIEHYPVYLILGNTLFALMSDSTTSAMTSIIDSAPLIKKIKIEKLIFPLEKVLFATLNFLLSLIAVAAVMIYFQLVPTLNILLLPLLVAVVMIFSAGLGLLLSSLAVFFLDIVHLWQVVVTAWTYATPLFYSIDLLPPWMQAAEMFNPMYIYVTIFRDIALWGTTPDLIMICLSVVYALVTFGIGLLVFKKTQKKFILYV